MNQQLFFDLPHRVAFDRANFLITASNAAAVAMIDRWPEWPQPVMALIGSQGAGKTHLASVWQKQSGAQSLYQEPSHAHLLADDLDQSLDKINEADLFTLLNQLLHDRGRRRTCLITVSAIDWWQQLAMPDLRSRLAAVPVLEIMPPDEQLIGAMLVKLFADRQRQISETLVSWLLPRMERSFIAAQRIVEQLDNASVQQQKPITLVLAREVLFSQSGSCPDRK